LSDFIRFFGYLDDPKAENADKSQSFLGHNVTQLEWVVKERTRLEKVQYKINDPSKTVSLERTSQISSNLTIKD